MKALAAVFLVALAGITHAGSNDAGAWRWCLHKEVRAIDDGISSAGDIATAVEGSCQPEFHAMVESLKLDGVGRHWWDVHGEQVTRDAATRIVLQQRAARRSVTASAPR